MLGDVKATGSRKPTPEEEAEQGAYRLTPKEGEKVGQLYTPCDHIYEACVRTGSLFQVKGMGKKTYKDVVQGYMVIEPEYIPHFYADGRPRFDYEIDKRPVRIQRGRIIRARPLLREWRLTFSVRILDSSRLPLQVMNSIIVAAGQTKGIGDYRPRFGRFIVTKFELV